MIMLAKITDFCKLLLNYVRQPSKQRSQSLRKIRIKRHVSAGGACTSLTCSKFTKCCLIMSVNRNPSGVLHCIFRICKLFCIASLATHLPHLPHICHTYATHLPHEILCIKPQSETASRFLNIKELTFYRAHGYEFYTRNLVWQMCGKCVAIVWQVGLRMKCKENHGLGA